MGGLTLFDITRDVPGDDQGIHIGMTALTLDAIEPTESHTKRIPRESPGNPEEDLVPCFLAVMALSCTCTLFGCRACRLSYVVDIANLKIHVSSKPVLKTLYPVCKS